MPERITDKAALSGKKCCAEVMVDTYWSRTTPCRNWAKVIENGKPYCGIHDPEKSRAKRARWDAEYERRQKQRDEEAQERKENSRRLSRYDEAISLLREAIPFLCGWNGYQEKVEKIEAFLAAEPKGPA